MDGISRYVRGRHGLVSLFAVMVTAGVAVGGAWQQAQHPILLTGVQWTSFSVQEKQHYLTGFIAGAAAEEARGIAQSAHRDDDSSAVSSGAMQRIRVGAGLHFRFAPSVYMAQLDDFYWWENHTATPIVDAMIAINGQMLVQHSPDAP